MCTGTAILKPPMLTAVDLHEFANAVAPGAGLMHALPPLLAIEPQPSLDHPQPQYLSTERDPMNLAQLLRRQSRSKIPHHSRIIASTARRSTSGLRRLLRRPR